jgi:hypothetical protein
MVFGLFLSFGRGKRRSKLQPVARPLSLVPRVFPAMSLPPLFLFPEPSCSMRREHAPRRMDAVHMLSLIRSPLHVRNASDAKRLAPKSMQLCMLQPPPSLPPFTPYCSFPMETQQAVASPLFSTRITGKKPPRGKGHLPDLTLLSNHRTETCPSTFVDHLAPRLLCPWLEPLRIAVGFHDIKGYLALPHSPVSHLGKTGQTKTPWIESV